MIIGRLLYTWTGGTCYNGYNEYKIHCYYKRQRNIPGLVVLLVTMATMKYKIHWIENYTWTTVLSCCYGYNDFYGIQFILGYMILGYKLLNLVSCNCFCLQHWYGEASENLIMTIIYAYVSLQLDLYITALLYTAKL